MNVLYVADNACMTMNMTTVHHKLKSLSQGAQLQVSISTKA